MEDRYQQSRPSERLVLDQQSYRISISLSFLVWAFVLVGLAFIVKIPTFLKRDDFTGVAQVAANISAICLTLFTILHSLDPRGKYLKLALAGLSLDFVLATLLSILVLATTDTVSESFTQQISVLIMGGALVGIGVVGMFTAEIEWLIPIAEKNNLTLRIKPSIPRATGSLVDYSVIAFPFFAVVLWANPLNLVSATLVLTIGGLVYLVVISVVFAIQTINPPKSDEDKLKPIVLKILHDIHSARLGAMIHTTLYEMVTLEALTLELEKRYIFREGDAIKRLLQEMDREESIVYDWHSGGSYIHPTRAEDQLVTDLLRPVALAITGYVSSSSGAHQERDNTFLCDFLSKGTRYPLEVVKRIFLDKARDVLDRNFSLKLPWDGTGVLFCAKEEKVLARFNEIQNRHWAGSSANKQIMPLDALDEDDSDIIFQLYQELLNELVTIPIDIQELRNYRHCAYLLSRLQADPQSRFCIGRRDANSTETAEAIEIMMPDYVCYSANSGDNL